MWRLLYRERVYLIGQRGRQFYGAIYTSPTGKQKKKKDLHRAHVSEDEFFFCFPPPNPGRSSNTSPALLSQTMFPVRFVRLARIKKVTESCRESPSFCPPALYVIRVTTLHVDLYYKKLIARVTSRFLDSEKSSPNFARSRRMQRRKVREQHVKMSAFRSNTHDFAPYRSSRCFFLSLTRARAHFRRSVAGGRDDHLTRFFFFFCFLPRRLDSAGSYRSGVPATRLAAETPLKPKTYGVQLRRNDI